MKKTGPYFSLVLLALLCSCEPTALVEETPVGIAFAGTSLSCMEGDGQLVVPITLSSAATRAFALTLSSDDAEARRALGLPVQVEVPAGATKTEATLTLADDDEVSPDRRFQLSLSASPTAGVDVLPEASVCEVTVLNDDASIGFVRPELRMVMSRNNYYVLPIVIQGYQTEAVTVQVTLDELEGVRLVDDGTVIIDPDTHTGYAVVEQDSKLAVDSREALARIISTSKKMIMTRTETKVINVSICDNFTGQWNLFVADYEDQQGRQLNRYIPAEITRLTPSAEIDFKTAEQIDYRCTFAMNDEQVYFDINWYPQTDKLIPIISGNEAYPTYNAEGRYTGLVMYEFTPERLSEIELDAYNCISTYYNFKTENQTLYLVKFDTDVQFQYEIGVFRGNISLVRPVEEDFNPLIPSEKK